MDYFGINTTGLLIRFVGKITGRNTLTHLVYVDDGWGYQDGFFPTIGVQVHIPAGVALLLTGKKVIVTGISRVQSYTLAEWREVNGDWYLPGTIIYMPSIWARDAEDIRALP